MFKTANINNVKTSKINAIDFRLGGNTYPHLFVIDSSSTIWSWGGGDTTYLAGGNTLDKVPFGEPIYFVSPWTQFAASILHSVFLDSSSYAWAWGDNAYGELGTNTTTNAYLPVSVVGGRQFISIDAGTALSTLYPNTCALDSSSYAWTWGYNGAGQLGDGTSIGKSSPVSVLSGRQFIKLIDGYYSMCALDGLSYAWGWGQSGFNSSSPISVVGGIQWKQVKPFGSNSTSGGYIGLDISSNVWGWGDNTYNPLLLAAATGTTASSPVQLLSGSKWLNVFANTRSNSIFAMDSSSKIWAWGLGSGIGIGTGTGNIYSPIIMSQFPANTVKVDSLTISTSNGGGVGLTADNKFFFWSSFTPTLDPPLSGSTSNINFFGNLLQRNKYIHTYNATSNNICSATNYGLLLDTSSYLWAWGVDTTYTKIASKNPATFFIPNVSTFIQPRKLYRSVWGNGALDANSYAWTFGDNTSNTLGDGTTLSRSSPVSVLGNQQWLYIINNVTYYHMIGLNNSSYAWCWGANGSGQLGNNSIIDTYSPVSVVGARQFKTVCVSASSAAGLNLSGYAWAWGANNTGSCGDGTTTNRSSPISVIGGRVFTKLVGNNDTFLALDQSSYAWAWGSDGNGCLGNGTYANTSSPVSVIGGRQFVNIFGNCYISLFLALDNSGYAWAWGRNDYGGLGDGSSSPRSSPTSVNAALRWSTLIPGQANNFGVTTGSSALWGWGQGGITNGSLLANNQSTPVLVPLSLIRTEFVQPTDIFGKLVK